MGTPPLIEVPRARRHAAGICKCARTFDAFPCHCERSEAIIIPLRTAMEIAAHAIGLDPRVAALRVMTDRPNLSAFPRLPWGVDQPRRQPRDAAPSTGGKTGATDDPRLGDRDVGLQPDGRNQSAAARSSMSNSVMPRLGC